MSSLLSSQDNMTYQTVPYRYGDEIFAIETDRLRLSVYRRSAYKKVTDYLVRNRDFHKQFSQPQPDTYFTYAAQKEYLDCDLRSYRRGNLVPLWITLKEDNSKIIGRVSLFNIARGGMMLAQLGYHMDKEYTGQGIMTEAVNAACELMFEVMQLHRIEAFILPENLKSIALIKRCGFEYEGTRYSYMNINGKFRDHTVYYRLRP